VPFLFQIRAATHTDIPAVLALWQAARSDHAETPDTPESLARLLETDPGALLVAGGVGGPVGPAGDVAAALSRGPDVAGALDPATGVEGPLNPTADVAGALIAAFDGWRGNLYRLAVAPSRRREGLARALVEAGEQRLRALGAPKATALVGRGDEAAEALWRAVGYRDDVGIGRWVRRLT
jgi:ribosomal protein S18 acetylase RimI-like enzyme